MADIDFIYHQPKWRRRKTVKNFVTALSIGAATLSLHYVYKQNEQGWSRNTVLVQKSDKLPREQMVLSTLVFVTSGSTWTVPADCASVSQVDCIGAGGSGAVSIGAFLVTGGAGGGWSRSTNIAVTPNGSINVGVGTGGPSASRGTSGTSLGSAGGDTWWNATSLANAVSNGSSVSCGAQGGSGGKNAGSGSTAAAAAGGASASGVGASKNSGGASGTAGTTSNSASGGGGAGGPNGTGTASSNANATATAGGSGDAGSGGGGSAASNTGGTTSAGSTGTEIDGSHGSGGGSGACRNTSASNVTSGSGGNYGGGSGGACNSTTGGTITSGVGGPGLIAITYTPAVPGVTSLSPTFGPSLGGTPVTITGTNFTAATSATFGGNNGTSFNVASSTSITVTSPSGSGVVDVRVVAAAGTSPIVAGDQFTYRAPVVFARPRPLLRR